MVAAGRLDLKQYCLGLIMPFVPRISIRPVATAPRMSLPIFHEPAFPHRDQRGRTDSIPFARYNQRLEVPEINAVDTPGAGDVFHGAFCHYILGEFHPCLWLRLQGRLLFL